LPGWANIIQNSSLHGVADFRLGMDMLNFIFRNLSFLMWLISKIDMDVHTGNVDFRTAQHHLDVDSPLNALRFMFLPILMVSMLLGQLGRGWM
jgi:hypothetical protein